VSDQRKTKVYEINETAQAHQSRKVTQFQPQQGTNNTLNFEL